jgi:diphthamide synthase (EF-2-diphthine--ammonia ligase)
VKIRDIVDKLGLDDQSERKNQIKRGRGFDFGIVGVLAEKLTKSLLCRSLS